MWTQPDGKIFARGKPQKHQTPAYITCSYNDIVVTTVLENDRVPPSLLRSLENHGTVPMHPPWHVFIPSRKSPNDSIGGLTSKPVTDGYDLKKNWNSQEKTSADGGHSGCWWDERCGVNHSTLCLVGWTQLKYLPLVGTCHHAPTGGSRALSHLSVCICREFPRGAILVLISWWSIVEGFFPVNPAVMGRRW